jgi:hypothetical protein
VFEATGLVVTANVATVAFAGTVTVPSTCAAEVLLLESVTTAPPAGAGPERVTVPVDEPPPCTDEGLRLIDVSIGTELKLTADVFVPLIETLWLGGVKRNPVLLGVTV